MTAALFFWVACTTPPATTNQPAQSPPKDELSAVIQKICATEFGGDMAQVAIFRDEKSSPKLLVLQPDISRFSHAPWTYYSPTGELLLTVPERPMSPEERAADPTIQKMEALKKGLTEDSKSTFCKTP